MIYLKQGKFPTVINLSNQANLCEANKTELSQLNLVVILGLKHLNHYEDNRDETPISIKIKKSGEVELSGIDENMLNDNENVRVYSDKKVSRTEENMEGE